MDTDAEMVVGEEEGMYLETISPHNAEIVTHGTLRTSTLSYDTPKCLERFHFTDFQRPRGERDEGDLVTCTKPPPPPPPLRGEEGTLHLISYYYGRWVRDKVQGRWRSAGIGPLEDDEWRGGDEVRVLPLLRWERLLARADEHQLETDVIRRAPKIRTPYSE